MKIYTYLLIIISSMLIFSNQSYHKFKDFIQRTYLKISLFLFSLFATNSVLADVIADANSQSGDTGMQQIGKLLGSVGTAISGTSIMGISEMVQIYNLAIFSAGVLWLFYIMLKGTLDSAHDGEFLGKNTHSAWVPVRLAVAVSLMAPVAGGYSLAQVIMGGATGFGVWTANQIWAVQNTDLEEGEQIKNKVIVSDINVDAIANMVKMGVCQKGMNTYLEFIQSDESYQLKNDGSEFVTYRKGASVGGDYSCGAIEFQIDNPQGLDLTNDASVVSKLNSLVTKSMNVGNGLWKPIFNTETTTAPAFSGDFNTNNLYTHLRSDIDGVRKEIATKIENSNKAKEAQLETKINGFKSMVGDSDSWFFAGAKWIEKSLVLSVSGGVIVIQHSSQNPVDNTVKSSFLNAPISNAMSWWNNRGVEGGAESEKAALDAITLINQKTVDGALKQGQSLKNTKPTETDTTPATASIFDLISKPEKAWSGEFDAFTTLVSLGQTMFSYASTGVLYGATAQLAGGVMQAIPVLGKATGKAIEGIASIIVGVSLFILIPAITLGFYLPLIPLINWITGILTWMITVIEAVLAAPLWALVHLDPQGEGAVTQKSAHGYIFLFAVVLMPSLMIFGLVLGYALLKIILPFIVISIGYVFVSWAMAQGVTDLDAYITNFLFSPATSLVLYLGLPLFLYFTAATIIQRCFSLIHVLPNQIIGWVGGRMDTTGQSDAGQMGQATVGGIAGAKMMGNSLKGGSQSLKQAGLGIGGMKEAWKKNKKT